MSMAYPVFPSVGHSISPQTAGTTPLRPAATSSRRMRSGRLRTFAASRYIASTDRMRTVSLTGSVPTVPPKFHMAIAEQPAVMTTMKPYASAEGVDSAAGRRTSSPTARTIRSVAVAPATLAPATPRVAVDHSSRTGRMATNSSRNAAGRRNPSDTRPIAPTIPTATYQRPVCARATAAAALAAAAAATWCAGPRPSRTRTAPDARASAPRRAPTAVPPGAWLVPTEAVICSTQRAPARELPRGGGGGVEGSRAHLGRRPRRRGRRRPAVQHGRDARAGGPPGRPARAQQAPPAGRGAPALPAREEGVQVGGGAGARDGGVVAERRPPLRTGDVEHRDGGAAERGLQRCGR